MLLATIRKRTSAPIRFVIDTHYHPDHVAGNGVFADTGAIVLAPRNVGLVMHSSTPGRLPWQPATGNGNCSMSFADENIRQMEAELGGRKEIPRPGRAARLPAKELPAGTCRNKFSASVNKVSDLRTQLRCGSV